MSRYESFQTIDFKPSSVARTSGVGVVVVGVVIFRGKSTLCIGTSEIFKVANARYRAIAFSQ